MLVKSVKQKRSAKNILLGVLLIFPFQLFPWNGTGTNNDPYLISTETELRQLALEVNEGNTFTGTYFQIINNITLTQVWTPIGTNYSFQGFFNGNNYTISELSINGSGSMNGLFGNFSNGRIENVTISGNITNNNSSGACAGICYICNNGEIINCTNNCMITGVASISGICHLCTNGSITNCTNNGHLTSTGAGYTSGICMQINNSTITNCINNGTINSNNPTESSFFCGICAQAVNASSITNCQNSGNITGGFSCGICTTSRDESMINGCVNLANITGTYSYGSAAGIIIDCEGNVSNCSNSGVVSGYSSVGIAGSSNTTITHCYNTGAISGFGIASGICNDTNGTISFCYNTGSISCYSSNMCIGGGISASISGIINHCYNTGIVKGHYASGGICGSSATNSEFQISNCYNSGLISSQQSAGGILGNQGYYSNGSISSCYNSGYVHDEGYWHNGAIIGSDNAEILSNCFYDKQMCQNDEDDIPGHIEGRLTTNMTGSSLQNNLGNSHWTFSSNMYPRLKELDNTESAIVSATPVSLYSTGNAFDNCDQVTRNFTVGTSNGVSWVRHGSGNALNISGISNGNVSINSSGNDTLAAKKNGTIYKLVPFHVYAPVTISATAVPQNGGTITGTGQYYYGETVELKAIPINNYSFTNWTEYGNVVSTDATFSFTANANRQLKANFTLYDSSDELSEIPICIYPNPSKDYVFIEGMEIIGVCVYNRFGQLLYFMHNASNEIVQIPITDLPNGIYFLELQFTGGVVTKKIIKK